MLASALNVEHAENFLVHIALNACLTIGAVLGINRASRKQCTHKRLLEFALMSPAVAAMLLLLLCVCFQDALLLMFVCPAFVYEGLLMLMYC